MLKKKVIRCFIGIIVLLFVGYNIFWCFGIYRVYSKCEKDFNEVADSGVRIYVDDEEYQYSVNKPNYLFWDGNLAIAEKDMKHTLIIWLDIFGNDTKEGVMLTTENGEMLQVELKDSVTAVDSCNQEVVDENIEIISKLYEKANEKWGLGIG